MINDRLKNLFFSFYMYYKGKQYYGSNVAEKQIMIKKSAFFNMIGNIQ